MKISASTFSKLCGWVKTNALAISLDDNAEDEDEEDVAGERSPTVGGGNKRFHLF